jgi:hypothetical protein
MYTFLPPPKNPQIFIDNAVLVSKNDFLPVVVVELSTRTLTRKQGVKI